MTQAYPLQWPEGWPRTPAYERRHERRFQTSFDATRDALRRELTLFGSKSFVISCNLAAKIDGTHRVARAGQLLEDPGVAVYFDQDGEPRVMASDRFLTPQDNLRSIYLAIMGLRAVERHGGGYMMKRAFGGFAALPPPTEAAAAEKPWREVFAPIPAGLDNADLLAILNSRYRNRAAAAHSDIGGSDQLMIILNAAIAAARAELGRG